MIQTSKQFEQISKLSGVLNAVTIATYYGAQSKIENGLLIPIKETSFGIKYKHIHDINNWFVVYLYETNGYYTAHSNY